MTNARHEAKHVSRSAEMSLYIGGEVCQQHGLQRGKGIPCVEGGVWYRRHARTSYRGVKRSRLPQVAVWAFRMLLGIPLPRVWAFRPYLGKGIGPSHFYNRLDVMMKQVDFMFVDVKIRCHGEFHRDFDDENSL